MKTAGFSAVSAGLLVKTAGFFSITAGFLIETDGFFIKEDKITRECHL
ncbi:hypothetical protein [Rossellomorea aquimaris]|uniref:Uncharacterized protein n=1 Tax=Rossellomorea aquimaris TaxID=189382 RepID=A0A366ENH8_9BACI|nr:hypothetical protein [Rossellomorea aquimaris]RBP03972.1 hypothetical protein DET59_107120 [Rossellomorea aquimaris]